MALIEGSSGIVGALVLTTAVEPVLTLIFDAVRDLAEEFEVGFDLDPAGRGRASVEGVSDGGTEASA